MQESLAPETTSHDHSSSDVIPVFELQQYEITHKDKFDALIAHYTNLGVSDFMIGSRRAIKAKLHGRNIFITEFSVTDQQTSEIAEQIYKGRGLSAELFGKGLPCSYSFRHKNEQYRYRVNIVREYNGVFIVMRPIDSVPPKWSDLDLEPEILEAYVKLLTSTNNEIMGSALLFAGETGSGKSSSIASMNRYIFEESPLREQGLNFYTAESPLEYLYTEIDEGTSAIAQMEVPKNTEKFSGAIYEMLRMDPDVIMVGETRDYETLDAMIQASETGHVVITTIHANSVSQVVNRMLGMIPDHLRTQGEIKKVLSLLGIVVFQKLLRRKEVDASQKRGGRVAVREYLVFTEEVQNYLLDHMDDLTRATQYCVEKYGRSYQQHFNQLADEGVIDVRH